MVNLYELLQDTRVIGFRLIAYDAHVCERTHLT